MTILLHGPDDYRRVLRQQALAAQFAEKYGEIGQQSFDASDEDELRAFSEALRATSLFSPRRFVLLTNALEAPNAILKDALARTADSKTLHCVLSDPAKTITKAQAFLTKPPIKIEPFQYLEGAAWLKFIATIAEREGVTLSKDLTSKLADIYSGNTWGLVTEIQTLALYTKPNKDTHTSQPVTLQGSLWAQLGGLRSPSRPHRLAQLERMIAAGEPAPKLFALLSYQSKIILPEAAALDRRIKGGKLDYDDALLALVIS
jgi:DNA polymerase III delta subunit